MLWMWYQRTPMLKPQPTKKHVGRNSWYNPDNKTKHRALDKPLFQLYTLPMTLQFSYGASCYVTGWMLICSELVYCVKHLQDQWLFSIVCMLHSMISYIWTPGTESVWLNCNIWNSTKWHVNNSRDTLLPSDRACTWMENNKNTRKAKSNEHAYSVLHREWMHYKTPVHCVELPSELMHDRKVTLPHIVSPVLVVITPVIRMIHKTLRTTRM